MSSYCFFFVNLLNFLPKINRCWTTFETLAEMERDCKERQLCMGDCFYSILLVNGGHCIGDCDYLLLEVIYFLVAYFSFGLNGKESGKLAGVIKSLFSWKDG